MIELDTRKYSTLSFSFDKFVVLAEWLGKLLSFNAKWKWILTSIKLKIVGL